MTAEAKVQTIHTGPLLAGAEHVFGALRCSAIVASGMATWLGLSGSVGASFYSGTAGIGLALAEFARASGEGWAADLAKQAIAHALQHAADIPVDHRLGFHSGWSGIAFAVARTTWLLDGAEVDQAAAELLRAMAGQPVSGQFDLISGAAGAVMAGAIMGPAYGRVALELAETAANRLRASARTSKRGLRDVATWRAPETARALPLTGVAHGAAGVGWALVELWASRRELLWLKELAELAFAYEDWTFDPAEQNWPDLRHYPSWRATKLLPPPHQVAWCHGAAGIALSRMRAFEITGDLTFKSKALCAGETVRQTLIAEMDQQGPACLCHGSGGNADILRVLALRLEEPGVAAQVGAVADNVAARLGSPNEGKPAERDPGLMLGMAGLGAFLLRAAAGDSVSMLAPTLTDSLP